MALPTGPIPRIDYDEIIEESWGDSVAQSLNNLAQGYDQILWTVPAGTSYLAPTTYTSTGTLDVWFTIGGTTPLEITVPDWASHVLINVSLNGLSLNGTGDGTFDCQLSVGPEVGRRIRRTATQIGSITTPDDRDWFGFNWLDRMPVDDLAGDRVLRIRAGQYGSAGAEMRWLADEYTDVAVFMTFQGAVQFYGGL